MARVVKSHKWNCFYMRIMTDLWWKKYNMQFGLQIKINIAVMLSYACIICSIPLFGYWTLTQMAVVAWFVQLISLTATDTLTTEYILRLFNIVPLQNRRFGASKWVCIDQRTIAYCVWCHIFSLSSDWCLYELSCTWWRILSYCTTKHTSTAQHTEMHFNTLV